jgi:hypothetical protein
MNTEYKEYKGWKISIEQDDCNESPREWDNLGTMACWHRRMNLGDVKETHRYSPIEWMIHELIYNYEAQIPYPKDSYCEDWLCEDDERVYKYFDKFYVKLPIHVYEHGGITISSGGFSDPWDSGQLGFIYVSKEKALKEFSQKKWSKKLEEKVIRILDGEIETYDQFLTGDVWGYNIYRPEDEDCDDSVDSCWGFYGHKYCMEEVKAMVDWNIENDKKQEKLLNSCMSL